MNIVNSAQEDFDLIFSLYDQAVLFQKTKFNKTWLPFDPDMVRKEIDERLQWKISINNEAACIFAISFQDPDIWGSRDQMDAVYIHRIVTKPTFRGNNFVKIIAQWAVDFAKERNLSYVRMDTWGDNEKLKTHYISSGFEFVGTVTPADTNKLPAHYSAISLSLFEIKV